jgi:hypothetical protein
MNFEQSMQHSKSQTAFNMTSCSSLDEMYLLKLLTASTMPLNRKPLSNKAKQTSTTIKAKRSVKFSNMTRVATRPISQQELRTMWYEVEEYKFFQKECRRTIAAIKKAKGELSTLDPTEHCVRGLEQFLSVKQMVLRKKEAKRYIHVMMRQQYVQRRTGQSDPSRLQALSEIFSKQAGQRAYLRGVIDHALIVGQMEEI